MKLTVLGCSGGIAAAAVTHLTSRSNDDVLNRRRHNGHHHARLRATGVKIDHIFLTHAHLDHVLGLPLLLDSVGDLRTAPL